MNNELIERLYIELSYYPMASSLSEALKDSIHEIERLTKALEAKPVGEAVAFRANVDGVWFVASTHKFMKATLEKSDVTAEIHPLYTDPPPSQAVQALIDQAIESYINKTTLIKSVNLRTQAQPYLDELIAEIDELERIDFDEGGCYYPCSDGDNYRFDDVRAVLKKYRSAK